jgi:hypothetical protein
MPFVKLDLVHGNLSQQLDGFIIAAVLRFARPTSIWKSRG